MRGSMREGDHDFLVITSPNSNHTLVVTYAPRGVPDGMLCGYGVDPKRDTPGDSCIVKKDVEFTGQLKSD
jgi:hypothetical protein